MTDPNVIKVAAVKCRQSLLFQTRYLYKKNTGRKFIVNHHHEKIANALERVMRGECTRLIINIGPRYGKTELAVKSFIAHGIGLNPASKWIHLSYSDALALDNSEEIKDIITSDAYREIYPDVVLKKDSKSKQKWYTTAGGGVLARSSGGQVTGFGAGLVDAEVEKDEYGRPVEYGEDEPAGDEPIIEDYDNEEIIDFLDSIDTKEGFGGAIVIDDPIKPDDAKSETVRSKINERFDSTIRSRVNSRNTPIIIIMQRLDEEDLCGYLLANEPEEWEVISLPVIDEEGNALWPHKHTLEELGKLRKANEFVFDTQYMQDPTPKEGLMFPPGDLNYYRRPDIDLAKSEASVAFVDVADQGEDNHSVPFARIIGSKVFVNDVVFTKDGTDQNVPETLTKANEHRPQFMQVESNFGGSMYIQLLRMTRTPKLNGTTALIPMAASQSKHTRIITAAGFIIRYCYFLHPDEYEKGSPYDLFMRNLTRYMKKKGAVKHDDAPDSLAGLAKMIVTYFPHLFDAEYLGIAD